MITLWLWKCLINLNNQTIDSNLKEIKVHYLKGQKYLWTLALTISCRKVLVQW